MEKIKLDFGSFGEYEFNKGISVGEAVQKAMLKCVDPVMLCRINGRIKELCYVPYEDCNVELVTNCDKSGMRTYERGLLLVFLHAVYKACRGTKFEKAVIEYGIGRGIYCEIKGTRVTDKMVERIRENMKKSVEANLPIEKKTVPTAYARQMFKEMNMADKERLLKFRRSSNTNIYKLGNYIDYFYGFMPVNTGALKVFDVIRYQEGIVLVLPETDNPSKLADFEGRDKLFETLAVSNFWADMIGISTVGDLNEMITRTEYADYILMAEALQEKKIAEIAELVKRERGKKFVMIAGPSSSGKTTFSHRLSIQLKLIGFKPHPIALDDYYKNRSETPKNPDGSYDFECLEALDVQLFNSDMTRLLNGETVDMPTFNFKTGKREYKGNKLKLGEDDILVIEGIHGLNDKLSYSLPNESKFKIYISALTQLNIDEHNRIPTTDCRLLRRIVRDARTRGTLAKDTIKMWSSVRNGEEKYIFPFQESADVMFNSALIYELGVIKQYAEPLLFGIGPDDPEYEEAKRLLKFLEYFLSISPETIPNNSICREFVGGSCFNV